MAVMPGSLIVGYAELPDGIECVGTAVLDTGQAIRVRHFEPYPTPVEGIFGDIANAVKKTVKKIAKNKVVRGIVNTAVKVAEATPYGAAAKTALNIAKGVVKAARGKGRKKTVKRKRRGASKRRGRVRARRAKRRAPARRAKRRAPARRAKRRAPARRPLPSAAQIRAIRQLATQVHRDDRGAFLEKALGLR